MKKRIIAYDTTLGIDDHVFKLTRGEIIEVDDEKDKFSRINAVIQDKKVYAYWTTIDRISNPFSITDELDYETGMYK